MCPENQVYSLYIDNELPSPWKEKFETHFASCAHCQAQLEKYKAIQNIMQEDRIEVSQEMESRVWDRIHAKNHKELAFNNQRNRNFWRNSVSVPLPAVAAAAAVLIFAAFLALQNPRTTPVLQDFESAMAQGVQGFGNGNNLQEMISVNDMQNMNDVLQYLSREDTSDFLIIRLPDYREFSSIGEPELVRAADYSRRVDSR